MKPHDMEDDLDQFLDLYPSILRKAFWLCGGNWQDAEDITQDAYLIISQRYDKYNSELSKKYSWCVMILRSAYYDRFKRRKVNSLPIRRFSSFQLSELDGLGKPWSNTARRILPTKWGQFQKGGKLHYRLIGEREKGDIDFWFKEITRDNLKNYLCLHLDDETLKKLKTLSEKMFQTKFLIGLGFKREEIAKIEGVSVNTIKSRTFAANDKMKQGAHYEDKND